MRGERERVTKKGHENEEVKREGGIKEERWMKGEIRGRN